MVYSAGENSELPLMQKTHVHTQAHTHIAGDARSHGQYQSKHVTPLKLKETQQGSCHIMSTNNSGQSARADEKDRHKDSR